jgi:hypothetical protein
LHDEIVPPEFKEGSWKASGLFIAAQGEKELFPSHGKASFLRCSRLSGCPKRDA